MEISIMTSKQNNMEVWKDINEYNGYSVSNRGRIKSIRKGKERILKPVHLDAVINTLFFMIPNKKGSY